MSAASTLAKASGIIEPSGKKHDRAGHLGHCGKKVPSNMAEDVDTGRNEAQILHSTICAVLCTGDTGKQTSAHIDYSSAGKKKIR